MRIDLLFQMVVTAVLTAGYSVLFFKCIRPWRHQMWAAVIHGLLIPSLWFASGAMAFALGLTGSPVQDVWALMLCGAVSSALFHVIAALGERLHWWPTKAELLDRWHEGAANGGQG